MNETYALLMAAAFAGFTALLVHQENPNVLNTAYVRLNPQLSVAKR